MDTNSTLIEKKQDEIEKDYLLTDLGEISKKTKGFNLFVHWDGGASFKDWFADSEDPDNPF